MIKVLLSRNEICKKKVPSQLKLPLPRFPQSQPSPTLSRNPEIRGAWLALCVRVFVWHYKHKQLARKGNSFKMNVLCNSEWNHFQHILARCHSSFRGQGRWASFASIGSPTSCSRRTASEAVPFCWKVWPRFKRRKMMMFAKGLCEMCEWVVVTRKCKFR